MLSWIAVVTAVQIVIVYQPHLIGWSAQPASATAADVYVVARPIAVGQTAAVRLEGGTLVVIDSSGRAVSGAAAQSQLAGGNAALRIDGGTFVIGADKVDANVADPLDRMAEEPAAPIAEALTSLNFETLRLRDARMRLLLPDGRDELLTDLVGEVANRRRAGITLKGNGRWRGQAVAIDTVIGQPTEKRTPAVLPLKLSVKSAWLEIAFEGRLLSGEALQLQGQGEVRTPDVRQLAGWMGSYWPTGGGLANLSAKGQLDWTGATLALSKATIAMDGNEAAGALSLKVGGARPIVAGTLAYKSLNLTPYVGSLVDPSAASGRLSWQSLTSGALTLPLARLFDADVRLSTNRLLMGGLELGRSAAVISLKDGQLLADLAEFQVGGGRGIGQIVADLTSALPKLTLRCKIEDLDALRATTAVLGQGVLQGVATATADVTASGATVSELLGSLNGKVALSMRDGGRLGIDLKALLGAAQASEHVQGWATAGRGETPFETVDARILIANGTIAADGVRIAIAGQPWSATGSIDLPSAWLDVRVAPAPSALQAGAAVTNAIPAAGPPGQKLVGLHLTGPWASPTIRLDNAERRAEPFQPGWMRALLGRSAPP